MLGSQEAVAYNPYLNPHNSAAQRLIKLSGARRRTACVSLALTSTWIDARAGPAFAGTPFEDGRYLAGDFLPAPRQSRAHARRPKVKVIEHQASADEC
jgi:hypothetical protein